jgi:chromosome condensin MukBEF ATPase and DNA-binding subunit MukB
MEAAVAASGEHWEGRSQLEQLKQGAEETAELRHRLEEEEEALDLKKKTYVHNRSFAKAMGAEIKKVEGFVQEKEAICLELEERLMMVQHEEMVLQAETGGLCAALLQPAPPACLPADLELLCRSCWPACNVAGIGWSNC